MVALYRVTLPTVPKVSKSANTMYRKSWAVKLRHQRLSSNIVSRKLRRVLLILISFPIPWCQRCCSKLSIVLLRGVTDSTFAFYGLCFWENIYFRFSNFFLSLSPSLYNCFLFLLWEKDCIYHACTWNYNEFYVSLIDRWLLLLWCFI